MNRTVLIETSARHAHVTQEMLEILFGEGHQLTFKKELSQPGQFAAEERIRVIGEKGEFSAVSILGPVRPFTQVELSATDARAIGIKAPIRESGDIAGSGKCRIAGPAGEVELEEGVIIAKRHIHITPEIAEQYGVADKEIVGVKIKSGERSLIFDDVVLRVSPSFGLAMHIDTDESNAACAAAGTIGEIIKLA